MTFVLARTPSIANSKHWMRLASTRKVLPILFVAPTEISMGFRVVSSRHLPVSIYIDSAGNCTIYWNGILTHSVVNIPGWSPQADWYMGIGARTGFFDDFHLVDNFSLTGTSISYNEDFSGGPGLGTLYGDAIIYNEGLRLTRAISSQLGHGVFFRKPRRIVSRSRSISS